MIHAALLIEYPAGAKQTSKINDFTVSLLLCLNCLSHWHKWMDVYVCVYIYIRTNYRRKTSGMTASALGCTTPQFPEPLQRNAASDSPLQPPRAELPYTSKAQGTMAAV